jgi:hypothetical protein
MRRAIILGCATLLLGSLAAYAGPPDVPKSPVVHSQRVMESADGGFCSQAGDLWRCRQFSVQAMGEPSGKYRETIVRLDQWRSWPGGYAYRHVECPVPRQALRVMPDKAFVETTFDADSPDCFGYGETVTFEPYTSVPWLYTGMQTLEASLLAPGNQDRRVTSYTWKDNLTGTSQRENCHGGSGWNMQGGGFTMINLYRAFGPGEATGSFYYDTCGTTLK